MLPITSSGPSAPYQESNTGHSYSPSYRKQYGSGKYMKQYCHKFAAATSNPNTRRSVLIIGSVILILGTYLWFSLSGQHYDDFENYSDLNEKNKRFYFPNRFPELTEKAMQPDLHNTKIIFHSMDYSIIREEQREKLIVYLTALHRAVSVMELPLTASLRKALKDCEYYNKPPIYDSSSQHALELKFPELLRFLDKAAEMLESGRDSYYNHVVHLLQLLHPQAITISFDGEKGKNGEGDNQRRRRHYHSNHLDSKHAPETGQLTKSSFLDDYRHVFEDPLIYYVNSYFYSVVHCTHQPQLKEDWKSGFRYLQEIAPMVVSASEWKDNEGLDFLSPATHPKAGLFITSLVDSAPNVHRFSRQSFMRVDYDLTGYSPKDIVVPYYVAASSEHTEGKEGNHLTIDGNINDAAIKKRRSFQRRDTAVVYDSTSPIADAPRPPERDKLLVFIGHDHPIGGIRSQFKKELNKLSDVRDVLFVTYDGDSSSGVTVTDSVSSLSSSSSAVKYTEKAYRELLRTATFCLSIRGDTSSAARLFTIIDIGGCIPIIISDWQPLPFESLIDYSKFSLRFSERVVHDLPAMLTMLRTISSQKVENLKRGLQEAKSLLLFENSDNDLSILNPVSLTLIEFIQNREKYCHSLNDVNLPPMCMKIMNRLHAAEHLLKEKKISLSSAHSHLPREKVELKSIVFQ